MTYLLSMANITPPTANATTTTSPTTSLPPTLVCRKCHGSLWEWERREIRPLRPLSQRASEIGDPSTEHRFVCANPDCRYKAVKAQTQAFLKLLLSRGAAIEDAADTAEKPLLRLLDDGTFKQTALELGVQPAQIGTVDERLATMFPASTEELS